MTLTPDRLTLGAAALGNLFEAMTDAQAQGLLESAWEAGIRSFDTAPHYGLGLSEERLGQFLKQLPPGAAQVSTKVGRLLVERADGADEWDDNLFRVRASRARRWDFSAAGVRRSLEESLARLHIDRVRALYLHDPEQSPDPEQAMAEGLQTLAEIRQEGLADHVGVGSMDVALLERAVGCPPVSELMVAGRHTLIDGSAQRRVLPEANAQGVRVAAAAVFNSGLLATAEPAGPFDYDEAPTELVERARRIADVCRAHGTDLPTAALHFAALDPAVASVVVGMRTPEQVRQNLERAAATPDPALWPALASERLIPVVVA